MALELGISDNTLYRLVGEARQAQSQVRTRAAVRADAEEMTRVKRELERVTKDRDTFGRAAAFFAREHK